MEKDMKINVDNTINNICDCINKNLEENNFTEQSLGISRMIEALSELISSRASLY